MSQVDIELLLFNTVRDALAPYKPITADTNGLVHRLITRLTADGTLAPLDVNEDLYRQIKSTVVSGLERGQVANAYLDCTNMENMKAGRRVVEEYQAEGYTASLKANGQMQVRHPTSG
jgi:hypothetical protein